MNIKKHLLALGFAICPLIAFAQPNFNNYAHDLGYFLPKSLTVEQREVALAGNYNSTIPTPKQTRSGGCPHWTVW